VAGPYTTRFVLTSVVASRVVFTVPEFKRAVIQTVMFSNRGDATGGAYATIHGYQVIYKSVPVGENFQFTDLRVALYRRESCEIYLTHSGMAALIAGYLFEDPDNEGPPPVTIEQLELPRPLPSEVGGGVLASGAS